ncbi:hypothetical protein KI387_007744, partial [Taxus chinensis]
SHPTSEDVGFPGSVGHSAGTGYGSARPGDSSTGIDYYPAGPATGTGTDSKTDSSSSTNTRLS